MVKCEVCRKEEHKYKCPKCLCKYCSSGCFKTHKESDCGQSIPVTESKAAVEVSTTSRVAEDEYEDSKDRVSNEKLEMLGKSKELQELLDNPHLRNMLLHLDSASNPAEGMHKAMQEPIFTEFADTCLQIVEPDRQSSLNGT